MDNAKSRREFIKNGLFGLAGAALGSYGCSTTESVGKSGYAPEADTHVIKDGFYKFTDEGPMGEERKALVVVLTHSSEYVDDTDARMLALKRANAIMPDDVHLRKTVARNWEKHTNSNTGDITYEIGLFPSRLCSEKDEKHFNDFLSDSRIPDYPQ